MNKENKNIEEKIEGQVELTDDLADVVAYGVEAFNKPEEANIEMEKYEAKEGSNDKELKDGECVCTCGKHIEKEKVIEIVRAVVDKYNGKVVLAMSEVRDIANAIIAEISK